LHEGIEELTLPLEVFDGTEKAPLHYPVIRMCRAVKLADLPVIGLEVLDVFTREAHDGRLLLHNDERLRAERGRQAFKERP
jgi:hypothetical protein